MCQRASTMCQGHADQWLSQVCPAIDPPLPPTPFATQADPQGAGAGAKTPARSGYWTSPLTPSTFPHFSNFSIFRVAWRYGFGCGGLAKRRVETFGYPGLGVETADFVAWCEGWRLRWA